MKGFTKKRWHGIPVVAIAVLLALVLTAGGVFAAGYGFFTATLNAEVVEAVAVGVGTWDNLEPYGLYDDSLDDVNIVFSETGLTITTLGSGDTVGSGFAAGEWIVIPLNIRNGSDGALTLGASDNTTPDGLKLSYSYELNKGLETEPIPAGHEGQYLAYDFKAVGPFLPTWSGEIVAGNSGFSGSAVRNAQVLFVKISAPGNIATDTYSATLTLTRE